MKHFTLSLKIVSLLLLGGASLAQTSLEMFVSSRNTNSVKLYDGESGEYLGDFVSEGSGGLSKTQDVQFGPDGNLYSVGIDNNAILKYDADTGEFLGEFTSGYQLLGPTKFTFHSDGYLYVSQWGSKKVIPRFDAETGEFVDEFATSQLDLACGHAWDSEGNLFVADYGLQNVSIFNPQGTPIGSFVSFGDLDGPVNLWFNEEGNLIVLDWAKGEALEFEYPTGNLIGVFLTGLSRAEGFDFDPEGNIYVCDWITDQVLKYDQDGNLIGVFAEEGGMEAPNAVTFRVNSTTDISEGNKLPKKIELKQNYPNPFNPSTTIEFSIPQILKGSASLELYDLLGNKISTLKEGINLPGNYRLNFNAENLSSGVYFYKLSGEFIPLQVRKMILTK